MQIIGAYIIAKDEENSIAKAIDSLKPVCSQIVVLDTGSADDTPSIASRLGCEVYFYKWNNDFSEARNQALRYMRTDWVIALDSDEVLDFESFKNYENILNNNEIGGIRVVIKNLVDNQLSSVTTEHTYSRIFRVDPNIRYTGAIHEQINQSILDCNLKIIDSDIVIFHYGYSKQQEKRIERNRFLLEQELKRNTNDDWLRYHLAETEFAAGNVLKARELFEMAISSNQLLEEQIHKGFLRLAQIALKNNQYDDVFKQTNFHSLDTNVEGFRKFLIATALMLKGNFSEAKIYLDSDEVAISSMVDKTSLEDARKVLEQTGNI